MCNLNKACFARYLACVMVVQNVEEVVVDICFHNRFVEGFKEISKQLPDGWKLDFEVNLCLNCSRGSDDVEEMIREIVSGNGLDCSLRSLTRCLCLKPEINRESAQSFLEELPCEVRELFEKMSSDLATNKKLP